MCTFEFKKFVGELYKGLDSGLTDDAGSQQVGTLVTGGVPK